LSTDVVEAVVRVRGGVKFYRGAARAARAYVERDRSRADDYYLTDGSGVALQLVASLAQPVTVARSMDGDAYEKWVAGVDLDTEWPKGRLRQDADALRFVEVVVNGPKTWSLAAALHPEISEALDAAQDRAAAEIVSWLTEHATTRVGPRGRQVQVPVERLEAAVIRHYTSRAGDPHRHLHLQVNARVWAAGSWRGIHSVGVRDSIEAINGIGHAAVATDPRFRRVLAAHGFTLDPESSEIQQLAGYVGPFSARARQIRGHVDSYEAAWRAEHPGQEPGPALREAWDREAWARGRPDKVIPTDGAELIARWNNELREVGYRDPAGPLRLEGTLPGWINRDAAADLVISQLGAKRSAWNRADLRGHIEVLLAQTCLVADRAARAELAEDISARAADRCVPLLSSADVPEHIRSFTSPHVLEVETDLIDRLGRRAEQPARRVRVGGRGLVRIDPTQAAMVGALAGDGPLVVVEGAAGAGKTTALATTKRLLAQQGRRMLVVTPTLKAAEVAAAETGAEGHSAAWLIHQHGWSWDGDGHWTRDPEHEPHESARLKPGDLLLVDEAGMLDQDTARALLTIAEETGARIALVGDRHQLPAVGRGGVLDHAVAWAHPTAVVTLESVHRFTDPTYAQLSLWMRTGRNPAEVFDQLVRRGQIMVHPSEVERTTTLADIGAAGAGSNRGDLVIADTRDQVTDLNTAIRERRQAAHPAVPPAGHSAGQTLAAPQVSVVTARGEQVGVGDRVATRRNDPDLQVANRQTWTVAAVGSDGSLTLHGQSHGRDRTVPPSYAARFVELAYATTVHGAQGETVDRAHVVIGEHTGAAAAYVAMTRGRDSNTAHLVAEDLDDARKKWVEMFNRDRADLGPDHARGQAIDAIDRYGPQPARQLLTHGPRSRRRTAPAPPASLAPPQRAELGL
jgi:conjugative relaxase-like TrwC/TraI family protein